MKNKHIPQLMDELTKKGAHIVVQQCDIQDPVQVKTLFRQISEDMPPLRGVVHAPWIPMVSFEALFVQ
jgi:enoyl-[acyl-carrier-protein] reductase (NADH)